MAIRELSSQEVQNVSGGTFGLLSGQTAEEVKALSAGLAEAALGRPAEIAVATFAEWLKAQ